ncbi:hypothetical protein CCO03_09680 [Comamonas serinivorans]|uniref:Protein nucleotidyltransferase YdiU n=1 Tax=Comamonas serinivorans TaxID=1082851 RepID=A0A1Y0ENB0_9BURK|nr:YdiU family protein [Comamonas serinivorans]ARU04918.1 hypothetical protein CCO03_09680 [Comamonas serinivorans]
MPDPLLSSPQALAQLLQLAGGQARPLPHAFRDLSPAFGTRLPTAGLPAPHWVAGSDAMARELGLGEHWRALQDAPGLLDVLAGNQPEVASSIGPLSWSSVYSGHQFGVWAGQLGDGRAHSLGCVQDRHGQWQELQLKGAGRTPYSRMGDGRAVLRSSIREFLASEAMAALGVPTTRALALVGSDLPVAREEMETAAIVTRVAPSFIRFGHVEHFAARRDTHHLRLLTEFVVDEFMPACRDQAHAHDGKLAAALLAEVTQRTARLFAQFQALGFCHGVLNTDNMSILGLAMDYGPFQFMDGFDPGHICNHSDHAGRYSYNNQPSVAYWNLFCLAQALMPLIEDEQLVLRAVEPFQQAFSQALAGQMAAKLGVQPGNPDEPGDGDLAQGLLPILAAARADWPLFWRRLSHAVARGFDAAADGAPPTQQDPADLFTQPEHRRAFEGWLQDYRARLARQDAAAAGMTMLATNPEYVLRNHLCEHAITQAKAGDFSDVQRLLALVQAPFSPVPGAEDASDAAPAWAANICISCSS